MPVLEHLRMIRLLKEGQHIETFLGEDIVEGKQFVIRRTSLRQLGDAGRYRVEREMEALRTAESHWLVPNILSAEAEGFFYLVRPFIPGITLDARLPQKPLSVPETLAVGRNLMVALRIAHERGVLHLDVKPSNLIVGEGATLEGAILVDFSLPRRQPTEGIRRDQPAGGIRYMAPESIGLLDRDVAEEADLYSAGIVLYECLAGHPPFTGTMSEVLQQHLRARPTNLGTLGLSLPHALEEVIKRLLRKEPHDRYQSAQGVLADLEAISAALERGIAEPALVVGAYDRRKTLTEPAFIGRTEELDRLDAAVLRAAQGQGEPVYVESESGGGKTRLLEELPGRSAYRGVWILRGQGVAQGAQRPFQVLSGIVAGVLSASRVDSTLAERLRERLGPQCEAVCNALPELIPVLAPGFVTGALGPEAIGERRSLRALTAFLDALGSEQAPAALILDDCQWADTSSLEMIGHWQTWSEGGAGRRHVMLVVAFRSEEVSPDHPLRRIAPSSRLTLAPFEVGDIQNLVESMAGHVPHEMIATVVRLSGGNPFMASALLHGLVEAGALVPSSAGWRVEPAVLAEAQILSQQAAELLSHRLRLLQPELLEMLSWAAILGKEFEPELAASLAGLVPQEAGRMFSEAQQRRIIWSKKQDRYEFVHDKLREVILGLLSAEDRRVLHHRAGERIEAIDRTRVFELAYHYDAAGEPERAWTYALAAAEQSRAQFALEAAERQYRIAERGAKDADDPTRLRIYLGLADVLTLRGSYREAPRWYEKARALASDNLTRARIESKVGEVAFKSSDYDTAFQVCNQGLHLLGRKLPKRAVTFFLLFLGELVVHVLHALFPRLFTARQKLGTPRAEADLLAFSLYDRLIYLWYFAQAGKIPAGWACLRGLNLVETYPETVELGHGYSVLANIIAGGFPPLAFWSRKLRAKALAVQESLRTLHGQGQALVYCWPVSHAVMEFEDGIRYAEQGRKLLVLAGDQWDLNASYWGTALCHFCRGEVRAAIEECQTLHRMAKEIGDHQNVGNALWVWAQASAGHVPQPLIEEALKQRGLFFTTQISLLGAEGIRRLRENQPEAAITPLDEACRLAISKQLIDTLIGDILSWHAAALRMAAARMPPAAVQRRETLLLRAQARARQARFFGHIYPLLMPFALRESGLVAAALGRTRQARRFLDAAVALAERYRMPLQRALALHARGEVGLALDWSNAEAEMRAAMRELHSMGAEAAVMEARPSSEDTLPTLALLDRFANLLDKGRAIVTTLTKEAALAAACDAMLALLGAERCIVVEVVSAGGGIAIRPVDPSEVGVPRELVEQAVLTGRPVVFSAASARDLDEGLLRSGVKSALCVPVFVQGSIAGCLYATHYQVTGLFREEEERLAEFIATLVSAALENAQNVANMEEIHKVMQTELERRVAERTAELEMANQELEAFSYSVSHDLRAPLRSIDGFSRILLEDYAAQLAPEVQRYLTIVRVNTQKMGQLIDDLLDFSRLSRYPLNKRLVIPVDLVNQVLSDMRVEQAGRQIEINIGDLPPCYADLSMLRQVFINLLANALKYTRSREVAVIEIGGRKKNGENVYFVKDNGVGFDMRYAHKLFGVFERLHSAEEYEGTGVGLAIVQRIIHRHGGRVWAEAVVDQGATLYFSLDGGISNA